MLKFSGFVGLTSCLGRWVLQTRPPRSTKPRCSKMMTRWAATETKTHECVQCICCASQAQEQAHCVCQGHTKKVILDTQRHTETQAAELPNMSLAIKGEDSEADRPSGMSRKHRIHSRFYWFTEFCNSQCLSHFAAPFISVQAKTFITEGCKKGRQGTNPAMHWKR